MKHDAWIGLDPSYSGFGLICLVEKGESSGPAFMEGLYDFSPAGAGEGAARLSEIHRALRQIFINLDCEFNVRAVAVEGYAPNAKFHREVLGELGGIVRLAAFNVLGPTCGAPITVGISAVKKFATGRGNAAKDDMKLAVYKKWGVEFASHDLADAYTIARIARAITVGTDVQYEQAVLDVLARRKPSA